MAALSRTTRHMLALSRRFGALNRNRVLYDSDAINAEHAKRIIMVNRTIFLGIAVLLIAAGLVLASQSLPGPSQPQRLVEINLVARQWYYDATIINKTDPIAQAMTIKTSNSFANTTIVVSKGDLVIIHFRTGDVSHGFAINGYPNVGPYEVTPGQIVTIRFTADKAGIFIFYCTEFCGAGHAEHRGTLIVLP
jgi:heme/copper-type cytochrome/quinol oxidase subunit 2